MLSGVNVALGVTGSIAAVKTVELAHELRRRGATVRAITTPAAESIVHPWSLEFATNAAVVTEITGAVQHVDLCGFDGWADVLLIAPATANTIGKVAGAVDDTPVTTCATTAIGAGVPVVIAPAMHEPMYDHPGVLDAIERLESWDVDFVPPRVEEGKAKIATADAIACAVARTTTPDSLAGRHVVVTSGATAESIDPIRVLTNRSSGRMGRAVARACFVRGARVTLVHGVVGPSSFEPPRRSGSDVTYASIRHVETATEMRDAVVEATDDADALVSAAAIGDFTVIEREGKLKSGGAVTLDLEPTPKVVDAVREDRPDLPIVGFKAETGGDDDALVREARRVLDRVGLVFVVANDASVMGASSARILLVRDRSVREHVGTKDVLAARIADALSAELPDRR